MVLDSDPIRRADLLMVLGSDQIGRADQLVVLDCQNGVVQKGSLVAAPPSCICHQHPSRLVGLMKPWWPAGNDFLRCHDDRQPTDT